MAENVYKNTISKRKAWINAARPRTLPLALSCIFMGSFLAAANGEFSWLVFALAVLTTILLQILSNLANDYGDSIHGADSADREGPSRAVQAGIITSASMKKAIILFAVLSLFSGVGLLLAGIPLEKTGVWITLFSLGIASIAAAITYTSGKKPYGYAGLGDISVFIFFGLVGVMGTYYLHVQELHWELVLPAISCGAFATAVLNVNNIRDIQSDKKAGKLSIPVRLGPLKARVYHLFLLVTGVATAFIYVILTFNNLLQFGFVITLPLIINNGYQVWKKNTAIELDPYLKQMALSTLAFVLTFGLGQII